MTGLVNQIPGCCIHQWIKCGSFSVDGLCGSYRFSILIVLRAVLTDTPNRSAIFIRRQELLIAVFPIYISHEADGRTGHSKPADGRYKSARQTKSVLVGILLIRGSMFTISLSITLFDEAVCSDVIRAFLYQLDQMPQLLPASSGSYP